MSAYYAHTNPLRSVTVNRHIPNHPNVVTFYGISISQNSLYIVTEFVPDGSLSTFLRNNINLVPTHVLVQMAKVSQIRSHSAIPFSPTVIVDLHRISSAAWTICKLMM